MLNGHPEQRLPNTLNVSFIGQIGIELLARMPQVAASTGSACHAGSTSISPVLAAMGVPHEDGMGSLRFSLGRTTIAWGSIVSSPPLSAPPDAPYDSVKQPLEMCRPPYRGAAVSGVGDS